MPWVAGTLVINTLTCSSWGTDVGKAVNFGMEPRLFVVTAWQERDRGEVAKEAARHSN